MSFQKLKVESYGIAGKHRSATKNIFCDITSKGSKVLIGYGSFGGTKKSITVSDNRTKAERLCDFLNRLGIKGKMN